MADKDDVPTLGVSVVVELRRAIGDHEAGTIALVIGQRPDTRYRYQIMVPGDPLPYAQPAENLIVRSKTPVDLTFDAAADNAFQLAQAQLADVTAERDRLRGRIERALDILRDALDAC